MTGIPGCPGNGSPGIHTLTLPLDPAPPDSLACSVLIFPLKNTYAKWHADPFSQSATVHPANQTSNIQTNLSIFNQPRCYRKFAISDSVSKNRVMLRETASYSNNVCLVGPPHEMSWVYAVSCCTIDWASIQSHNYNHSVTACFHKQLLLANSYKVPLSSVTVCMLAFKYWQR